MEGLPGLEMLGAAEGERTAGLLGGHGNHSSVVSQQVGLVTVVADFFGGVGGSGKGGGQCQGCQSSAFWRNSTFFSCLPLFSK